jgi:pimeloyl-ACP methyl ester carboxylesterase
MAADPRALPDRSRDGYARGYSRREALTAGFDWYRAFEKDAARNSVPARIELPVLYLRGDAGGRDIQDYVAGLRKAGATLLQSGVLPNSGEYAPEEAPEHLIQALRAFRRTCDAATERR